MYLLFETIRAVYSLTFRTFQNSFAYVVVACEIFTMMAMSDDGDDNRKIEKKKKLGARFVVFL